MKEVFIQNRNNYNYQNISFSKNNSYNIRKNYKVPQPKTRYAILAKMYNQSIPRKNIRNNIKNNFIQKINYNLMFHYIINYHLFIFYL